MSFELGDNFSSAAFITDEYGDPRWNNGTIYG